MKKFMVSVAIIASLIAITWEALINPVFAGMLRLAFVDPFMEIVDMLNFGLTFYFCLGYAIFFFIGLYAVYYDNQAKMRIMAAISGYLAVALATGTFLHFTGGFPKYFGISSPSIFPWTAIVFVVISVLLWFFGHVGLNNSIDSPLLEDATDI